jgi:hypothetical protein
MKNSLLSTAAFLAVALCGTPLLLAQQAADETSPSTPSETSTVAAAPQSQTTAVGVRIVRLSQANGDVQLDRQTGHGLEAAFANLPITQGGRLRTGDGVAEVEFEDNSSLRLTPNSLVEFPVLSAKPDGTRSSTVHVVQGEIYASMAKDKAGNLNVTFGKETLALGPASHIALNLTGNQPRLDVLDGTVQAVNGATTTTVSHKKGLLFDPANSAPPTLVSRNDKGDYDDWDKRAVEYHQRLAPSANSSYGATPYAYGLADMNYYGSFANVGGCGSMWRPYLVGAAWSPYSNGVWAYYPSAGYSWVSPYPWGWTAFHSGNWNYCGGGWGWQPGSQWNGLSNAPAVVNPAVAKLPSRLTTLRPPLGKPRPVGPTMVEVSQKPLVVSKMNGENTFVFQKDSAGLGVPRGTFGKLNRISSGVVQHGSVERTAFYAPGPNTQAGRGSMARNSGSTATHTMPASGRSSSPSHTSSAGSIMAGSRSSGSMGGGNMGGASHSAPSMGSMGGGASHPMSSAGSMGGASSAGGHH